MSKISGRSYQVRESTKLGGRWEQELVVVRGGEAFLRITGDGKNYRVMTATAGDDAARSKPVREKDRLFRATTQLASQHGHVADVGEDTSGRKFVMPFEVRQSFGQTDEKFTEFFYELFDEFFEIFDALEKGSMK